MSDGDGPRGAGGRRRYVPDWPGRGFTRARARMGRTMLVLGALIVLTVFAFGRRGGDDGPSTLLVLRSGGWYLTTEQPLIPVAVDRIVDGDTLDVLAFDGARLRVRVFGVNASERGERCAAEATARLGALAGGTVRLLADERTQDGSGRELRYLFAEDGRSIDAALISEGLATAWDADGALRDELVALERETRDAGRGCLWSAG